MNWHKRFLQQAGWTQELRGYLLAQAGLSHARRLLEVGCGTGAVLVSIPGDNAIRFGLDLDFERIAAARRNVPGASLACADALRLHYAARSFDLTCCHFFLLWVREPLQALLEMKRVTRSGGAILAFAEPDHTARIDKPASLAPLGRWQAESLRLQGADPALGFHLADLFRQAGIRLLETGKLQAHIDQPFSSEEWQLEWDILSADLAGLVPEMELASWKQADEAAWKQGVRSMYVPTYFAHGVV